LHLKVPGKKQANTLKSIGPANSCYVWLCVFWWICGEVATSAPEIDLSGWLTFFAFLWKCYQWVVYFMLLLFIWVVCSFQW